MPLDLSHPWEAAPGQRPGPSLALMSWHINHEGLRPSLTQSRGGEGP